MSMVGVQCDMSLGTPQKTHPSSVQWFQGLGSPCLGLWSSESCPAPAFKVHNAVSTLDSIFRILAEESPRQSFVLFESFDMEKSRSPCTGSRKMEPGSQGISPVCFS